VVSCCAVCAGGVWQDGIEMEFENFLDYSAFAVRIKEKDIPQMIEILKVPTSALKVLYCIVQYPLLSFTFSSCTLLQLRTIANGTHDGELAQHGLSSDQYCTVQ